MSGHFLIERIRGRGARAAIAEADAVRTWADLSAEIEKCGRELDRLAIGGGHVVAIASDYNMRSIALFVALLARGAIIVPVTTAIESELEEQLLESYADRVATFHGAELSLRTLTPRTPPHALISELRERSHAGLVLFSSGSTGRPKAMLHDLTTLAATFEPKAERDSTIMVFLMFDHIGGINTLFHALASGVTMVLPGRRDPERVCALVEAHRVDVLPASPTFLNLILLSEAYRHHDLSSLKLVTYGTEPMSETLLARLQDVFPNAKFLQTFGTSETGIAKTTSRSNVSTLLRIDDPNIEVRIVDGELWLRSGTRIMGYLNASMDSFSDDGWYRTGDVVEEHEGFLRITGRVSSVINVGGQKVLPGEVEGILLSAPFVADCLVFGRSNAVTGQQVCADLVLKPGHEGIDAKREVRRFCRDKLLPYKVPVQVNVVAALAHNERFKKVRLRES